MNFYKEYAQKLRTPEEAVKMIESGMWVDYGWCTAHPRILDKALAKHMRENELKDVKIRGGIALRPLEIFKMKNPQKYYIWNSWHMTGIERKMIKTGCAFYNPVRYSELPYYYKNDIDSVDIAMFQVASMDRHGFFNFGPNTSHMTELCKKAKVIVVEVNEKMPRCFGKYGEGIHISEVDFIVEGENETMDILPASTGDEASKIIASLVVPEIPDGACLQLGIGGLPNTVGQMIAESDLKDLGVHTEMYVDAFVDIARAGKITGNKKNFDQGKQVYAFGAGSQKLYDYLDENPECMGAPVNYVNDIHMIASQDNFVSINNAVNLDLFGQINSESNGINHISGAGGQQDFVMGAYLSKGGKSFICCTSTFKDKKGNVHSRILPTLQPGSIVTATRTNIHYLVTEYGKVSLKGTSTWERCEKIISIAHPDFRDELVKEAEKMKIWRKSNKI